MQRVSWKTINILLAIAMMLAVVSGFPQPVKADPTGSWADTVASASEGTDYSWNSDHTICTIKTATGLAWLASQVNSGVSFQGIMIQLYSDIDLAAHYWTPIGTAANPFKGYFEGNGHVISNMQIGTSASPDTALDSLGLFGCTEGAIIYNVGIKNCSIYSNYNGNVALGSLVGYALNQGMISNCYATGSINGGTGANVGGLVGSFSATGIQNCYSTASASGGAGAAVGGLTGSLAIGQMINCYAAGDTSGGENASVGGLIGNNSGFVQNSYWCQNSAQTVNGSPRADGDKKGAASGSDAGTGKSASDMQNGSFVDLLNGYDHLAGYSWKADGDNSNQGYPLLAVFGNASGSVVLDSRSSAGITAGDGQVTNLTPGKYYRVTVNPMGLSTIMYTRADGTLTLEEDQKAALGAGITAIAGLSNGTCYLVEEEAQYDDDVWVVGYPHVRLGKIFDDITNQLVNKVDVKIRSKLQGNYFYMVLKGGDNSCTCEQIATPGDNPRFIGGGNGELPTGNLAKIPVGSPMSGSIFGGGTYQLLACVKDAGNNYHPSTPTSVVFTFEGMSLSPGGTAGSMTANIFSTAGNQYVLNITDNEITAPAEGADPPSTGTYLKNNYQSLTDLTSADGVAVDKYVQVYVLNDQGKVAKFYQQQITQNSIKPHTETVLAQDSLGTAGDGTITGLTAGKIYKVTVDPAGSSPITMYTKADGNLTEKEAEIAALRTGVTAIIGLTNGTTYKVEEYVASGTQDYTITRSGENFQVNGAGTYATLKAALAVCTDQGADNKLVIQLGDGTNALELNSYAESNNSNDLITATYTGIANFTVTNNCVRGLSVRSGVNAIFKDLSITNTSSSYGYASVGIDQGGTLNIEDGTSVASSYADFITYPLIKNRGTVIMVGGTISGDTYTRTAIYNYDNATLNITGGSVTTLGTSMGTAVYNKGNAEISGTALLSAQTYGVDNSQETADKNLTINGGTIRSTVSSGKAVNSSKMGTINISGGVISTAGDTAIEVIYSSASSVIISGGVIESAGTKTLLMDKNNSAADNAYAEVYGVKIYRHNDADVIIAGVADGSKYVISGTDKDNAQVRTERIVSGKSFAAWTRDSERNTSISTINGATLSSLTTGDNTGVTSIYLKIDAAVSPPAALPTSGAFTDTDNNAGKIGGTISWTAADPPTGITGYRIYWGSSATTKLAANSTVQYTVTGAASTSQAVAADTALPEGATHFLVYSYNSGGESESCLAIAITDVRTVILESGSLGTPGDGKVTGLKAGKKYKVIVGGATKYVKADGTLSDNQTDAALLTGTEITGLVSGTTYKVENYKAPEDPDYMITRSGENFQVDGAGTYATLKAALAVCTDQGADGKLLIMLGDGTQPLEVNSCADTTTNNQLITAAYTGKVNFTVADGVCGFIIPDKISAAFKDLAITNTSSDSGFYAAMVESGGTLTTEEGTSIITTFNKEVNSQVIYNEGTLNINGGTVSGDANTGCTISNSGQLNITGGSVRCLHANGIAIRNIINNKCGSVTVSGTALVSGAMYGIDAGASTSSSIIVNGGTVEATGNGGVAILTRRTDITVTGGTIRSANAETSYGIRYTPISGAAGGKIKVSGGTISSAGTLSYSAAIYLEQEGNTEISGNAVVAGAQNGIVVATNNNAVAISGGSVESASTAAAAGAVNICGDSTVTITGGTQKSANANTLLLTMHQSPADTSKFAVYGLNVHCHNESHISIAGVVDSNDGNKHVLSSANKDNAAVKADISSGKMLAAWTSDSAGNNPVSTTNGATISSLTTGGNAGVTDIYLKTGDPASSLSVTVGPGTAVGSTQAAILGNPSAKFVIKITAEPVNEPCAGAPVPAGCADYTSGTDITSGVVAGKYLQVYNVNAQDEIVGFYQKQLSSSDIKVASYAPPFASGDVTISRAESAYAQVSIASAADYTGFICKVQLATEEAPVRDAMISSGAFLNNTKIVPLGKDVPDLTPNTEYKLYILAKKGEDYQENVTCIPFTTKAAAPAFASATITDITSSSAKFNVDWGSNNGRIAYGVVAGTIPPGAIKIRDMERILPISSFATTDGKGSINLSSTSGGENFEPNTTYTIVAIGYNDIGPDKATGNPQAALTILSFTTAASMSDADAVAGAKTALDANDFTYSGSDNQNSVTNNFTVPLSGENGTSITWTESSDAVSINAATGEVTVTRPANGSGDATVTLRATITKNGVSETKDITVTIKQQTGMSDADAAINTAKALIPASFSAVEGTHSNLLSYLNGIAGMSETGVTLTLESNNANVAADGTITYTGSAATGNVTVKINKANGTEQTVTIPVTVPAHAATPGEQANAAINTAKGLIPASFSAVEGTHGNLLSYLNGIAGMSETGVTLTLESNNANVAADGTITYGSSAATGNVTVKINKQNGTEQTVTISVTVPAHAADYKLTVPNFSIASQSIPNGETKTIQLQAAGSKLVVNGTEQADAAITYSYEEVGNSGLATITGSQLVLSPPATGSSATVTIKAIASWAGNGKSLAASRIVSFTVSNKGNPPCKCVISVPTLTIGNQDIKYNEDKTVILEASGAKIVGGCTVPGHADSQIIYSYQIISGERDGDDNNIASINGNVLTLNPVIAGTYTIAVQATASANGKTAVKTASFSITKQAAPPAAECTCSITAPVLAGGNLIVPSGANSATLDLSTKLTRGTLVGGCPVAGHDAASVSHVYAIKTGDSSYNTAGARLEGKNLIVTRTGTVTVTVTASANGKTSAAAEAVYNVSNADVAAAEAQIWALPNANTDTPSNDDSEINNASAAIRAAKTAFENLTAEEKEQTSLAKRNKLDTLINRLGLLQTSIDASGAGTTVTAAGLETAVNTTGDLAAGNNVNLTLKVEEASSSQSAEITEDSNIILACAESNQNLSAAFDVRLLKTVTEKTGDVTTENITEADAPVLITMAVPPGMRGGTDYKIYHVHTNADGSKELETIEATYDASTNPPTISFWIRKFSTVQIAYTPASADPQTGSSGRRGSKVQAASAQVDILVNGKTEKIGIFAEGKQDGRSFASVTPDEKELEQILQQEPDNVSITIPVNVDADILRGIISGQMVKDLENRQAVIKLAANQATYTVPALQINIDDLAGKIGHAIPLEDIEVQIEISKPAPKKAQGIEDVLRKNSFTVAAEVLDFTVRCVHGDQSVEISTFNTYVEKTIALPAGTKPNKITTGVIIEKDEGVRHVPTKVTKIGDKYYARINSLTNSTYSIIYNPRTFKDTQGHWAGEAINDMGSRLVVKGIDEDNFAPDRDITRAEFAAIMVRALGLRQSKGSQSFDDVKAGDWFSGYIATACEYGIISGCGNAKFGPSDKISREQAMIIINRTMKMTRLNSETQVKMDNLLAGYTDAQEISAYAQSDVAACLQNGIVTGRSTNLLAPKDSITRAEVAVIIQNLLKKSDLI